MLCFTGVRAFPQSSFPTLRILDRYIFGSVFGTTFGAVALLASVLVAGNMLKDLLSLATAGQLPGIVTLKLILLVLPIVVSYALPMGFLAGVLISFGRMSADQEITAMKCAGISVWRIAVPLLVVGLIGTFLGGFSNCFLAPRAQSAKRDMLLNLISQDPASYLEKREVIDKFKGYRIFVGEREGDTLSDFWVWELESEASGRVRRLLRARTGVFRVDYDHAALVLTLKDAFVEVRGKGLPGVTDTKAAPPPPGQGATGLRGDDGSNLAEFQQIELELSLKGLVGENTTMKRNSLTQDDLGARIEEGRSKLETIPVENKNERKALAVEISRDQVRWHRNLAMALSVLPMGLLALPLSFKTSRRETYVNAGLALGLGLIYYLFITVFEALQSKPQLFPHLLIWVPNLVFFAIGIRLIRRAARH